MLPRRLQRCLIEISIIVIVLVTVVIIIPWNRQSARDSFKDENSDFYHFYDVLGDNKPSVAMYSDVGRFKDGRRRTLNTSEGLVSVKDMMLVPKNPLPNGANLYKSMESSLGRGNRHRWSPVKNEFDSPPRGLDNFEEERVVNMRGVRRDAAFPNIAKDSNCTALPCTEFLSDRDTLHFQHCSKISRIDEEPPATTCSFRPPDSSVQMVALASSPGSGVDLLRWFLQELTGLCTGSLQCNTNLRRAGYAGESVRSTAVLGVAVDKVVAMDRLDPLWREVSRDTPVPQDGLQRGETSEVDDDIPAFDCAVYLLRNPFDAILEAWNQLQGSSGMR